MVPNPVGRDGGLKSGRTLWNGAQATMVMRALSHQPWAAVESYLAKTKTMENWCATVRCGWLLWI